MKNFAKTLKPNDRIFFSNGEICNVEFIDHTIESKVWLRNIPGTFFYEESGGRVGFYRFSDLNRFFNEGEVYKLDGDELELFKLLYE